MKFRYVVHYSDGAPFYKSALYDRLSAVNMLNRLVRLGCYMTVESHA